MSYSYLERGLITEPKITDWTKLVDPAHWIYLSLHCVVRVMGTHSSLCLTFVIQVLEFKPTSSCLQNKLFLHLNHLLILELRPFRFPKLLEPFATKSLSRGGWIIEPRFYFLRRSCSLSQEDSYFFFKTGPHYVSLTVTHCVDQPTWNTQKSTCLSLSSVGIKDMNYQAQSENSYFWHHGLLIIFHKECATRQWENEVSRKGRDFLF